MSDSLAPRGSPPLLVVLGGLSLIAVLTGVATCALSDVSASVWGRNLAAWVIGGGLALLASRAGPWLGPVALAAAAVLLGLSLLGPGQLGVHRWIAAGPASFNAAMLTLPAVLASVAWPGQRSRLWLLAPLALMAVLVAQPDRSQATAFGAAMIWLAIRTDLKAPVRAGLVLALVLMTAGAFVRPDPLEPVPEVEEILKLAFALSPALAAAGLGSLMAFSIAPAWLMRNASGAGRLAGEALTLYFLICAAAPFAGAYPVPLVGAGMSPILGAWLAAGVLAAKARRGQPA